MIDWSSLRKEAQNLDVSRSLVDYHAENVANEARIGQFSLGIGFHRGECGGRGEYLGRRVHPDKSNRPALRPHWRV